MMKQELLLLQKEMINSKCGQVGTSMALVNFLASIVSKLYSTTYPHQKFSSELFYRDYLSKTAGPYYTL
jgi:hypothetical protein